MTVKPLVLAAPRQPYAVFSPCERYRYLLAWPTGLDDERYALFVLANPSTATAEQTDPTVARCIQYAKRWGYGWCRVVNVRAWRETNPALVPADPLAISAPKDFGLNDDTIQAQAMGAAVVICGWGKLGGDRGAQVMAYLRAAGVTPHALAVNDDGTPRHPLARGKLALRATATPIPMPSHVGPASPAVSSQRYADEARWLDLPVSQWVRVQHDPTHLAPWCVLVADVVRARVPTRDEAEVIVASIERAFGLASREETEALLGERDHDSAASKLAWAQRHGVKESPATSRHCVCRLLGKQCRDFGACGHRPPGVDHPSLWLRNGKPAIFVYQPYGFTKVAQLGDFCRARGLRCFIDLWPAWHNPGHVLHIQIEKAEPSALSDNEDEE